PRGGGVEVGAVVQQRGEQGADDGDPGRSGHLDDGVDDPGGGAGVLGGHGRQDDVDQDRGDQPEPDAAEPETGQQVPGAQVVPGHGDRADQQEHGDGQRERPDGEQPAT